MSGSEAAVKTKFRREMGVGWGMGGVGWGG